MLVAGKCFICGMGDEVDHSAFLCHPRADWKSKRDALRDQFAMAALNGIIQWAYGDVPKNSDADLISADAYRLADAMMKAREGK